MEALAKYMQALFVIAALIAVFIVFIVLSAAIVSSRYDQKLEQQELQKELEAHRRSGMAQKQN